MTLLPPGVKVHLVLGYIDMRKGIDGLARRQFSQAGKRRIVEEAARPGASLSDVARGYIWMRKR
jgi:hypothetical protein